MNPFEMAVKCLPSQADKAEIKWSAVEGPRRKGNEIVLRLVDQMMFVPILEDKQFICCYPKDHSSYRTQPEIWFGGTDENPFLVRLGANQDVIVGVNTILKGEGVEPFFEALKPTRLSDVERLFGTKAKRQGDIFALPTRWSWTEFEKMSVLLGLFLKGAKDRDEWSLFQTRYSIKGRIVEVELRPERYGNDRIETTLATGMLEAPDHQPLELEKIHVLFQSAGLYSPQDAD